MTKWETCAICGKRKRELSGWYYPLEYLDKRGAVLLSRKPVWEGRVSACNQCVIPLEKAYDGANSTWGKMMKIKEEYLKQNPKKLKEELEKSARVKEEAWKLREEAKRKKEEASDDLDRVLNRHSGWIKVSVIRDELNAMGNAATSKAVAAMLREKGLTVCRRGHGVFCVYFP